MAGVLPRCYPKRFYVKREKIDQKFGIKFNGLMARRKGFEPLTPRFEVWCSIQLSYRRRGPRERLAHNA